VAIHTVGSTLPVVGLSMTGKRDLVAELLGRRFPRDGAGRKLRVRGLDGASTETTLSGVHVHPEDGEEIGDSWFVTYETGGKFRGFWTDSSDIVERLDAYLTATYLTG
jgi:hypothetical protein